MSEIFALTGARIFDGEDFHNHHAVIIQQGKIVDLVPTERLDFSIKRQELTGGILAPGFIDAQVNGGGGVMLNDAPTASIMAQIARAHRQFGTTSLLPTLITDQDSITVRALETAIDAVGKIDGVCGLHLEGPHLAPARKGAHQAQFMRPLEDVDVARLIEAATQIGTLLLTMAAEQITVKQVEQLTKNHVLVSLGHCDATYEQAMALFDAGARGVTHLFNAMSPLMARAPGLVGAALDHPAVWGGLIADGHHAHEASLRVAMAAKKGCDGEGQLFFVTDAMALVGTNEHSFTLNGRRIDRQQAEDGICSKLTLEDGTLAGSDLDMAASLRFGVARIGLSLEQALAMATSLPARFLRFVDRGFIAKGLRADLVHLNDDLHVMTTWIDGKC